MDELPTTPKLLLLLINLPIKTLIIICIAYLILITNKNGLVRSEN